MVTATASGQLQRYDLSALQRENRDFKQTDENLRKGELIERQWSKRHWRTRSARSRRAYGQFSRLQFGKPSEPNGRHVPTALLHLQRVVFRMA